MTWRRGFFRLWLVLAVLWLAGTVSIVGPDAYRWWPNKLIKLNVGGHEVRVDETFLSLTQDEQQKYVDEAAEVFKGGPPEVRPPSPSDDWKEWKSRVPPPNFAIEHPFNTAVWAATFVPPLALFALGLCIAWILRGFRPQKSASPRRSSLSLCSWYSSTLRALMYNSRGTSAQWRCAGADSQDCEPARQSRVDVGFP
jgi:hypothetical protein